MTVNDNKRPVVVESGLDIENVDQWSEDHKSLYVSEVAIDTNTVRAQQVDWYDAYTTYEKPIDRETAPAYVADDADAPDARLQNAFEKEIVDNLCNYLAAQEPTIKMPDDVSQTKFDSFRNVSGFHKNLLDSLKFSAACGTGGLILYQDGADVLLLPVKGYEYYALYDASGVNMLFAIRYYCERINNTTDQWYAELYTPNKIYNFKGSSSYAAGFKYVDEVEHYFGIVPLIETTVSPEEFPAFYPVRSLINAYDRLVSDYSNEMENFRHAIMVLINYSADSDDVKTLRKTRTIQITDDGDVKYLTKDIKPESFTTLIKILEKNIERFSGTLNYADPDVYGQATNLAISTRIKPLENNARAYGTRAKSMLLKMMNALSNFWGISVGSPVFEWRAVEISWNYDKPVNMVELIDVADKKQNNLGMSRQDAWEHLDIEVKTAIERADDDREQRFGTLLDIESETEDVE